MRVEVRQPDGSRVGRVSVDAEARPSRAQVEGSDREIYLDWEAAVDDAGRLRSCLVCGGRELYKVRQFPQLTGFVVVLAFAGAVVGIVGREGVAANPYVLAALTIVLLLDIASLIFRRHYLVCYRCRSRYAGVQIAKHHQSWDREKAERYLKRTSPPPTVRRTHEQSARVKQ